MAVLRKVHSGQVTMGAAATSVTVTIAPVDTGKSWLEFGNRVNSEDPRTSQIAGRITDSSTLTFSRDASAAAVEITWYVVEFTSGVSVQRGSTSVVTAGGTNVTISAVTLATSWPTINLETPGSSYSADDHISATLTSTTNLQLDVNTTNSSGTFYWQVIEFTGCTVEAGSTAFLSGDASKTQSITAVDLDKAWLVMSYRCDSGTSGTDLGRRMVRGRFTSTTELTFDRDVTGATVDVEWSVIEFTDDTTVQSGTQAFTTSETLKNATITAVELAKTIAVTAGVYSFGGKADIVGAGDQFGAGVFTLDLTTTTNLAMERGVTNSDTADIAWFHIKTRSLK